MHTKDEVIDYRKEIVNMSRQFVSLRFGQYLMNALGPDIDMLYAMSDVSLYEKCKEFNRFWFHR